MNNISKLKKILNEIKISKKEFVPFKTTQKINSLLLEINDKEMLNFHFSLLGIKGNKDLFYDIRASFKERPKRIIEPFLLEKLRTEKNSSMIADAIQILGNVRSIKVLPFIEENIKSEIRDIRYRCIIVLGWIGEVKDLSMLNDRMLHDVDGKLRGYGATAMRQIWHNHKSSRNAITNYINIAIKDENDKDALIGMIITIQELHRKKLGIKESKYGDISGDVFLAKTKTIKTLTNILNI